MPQPNILWIYCDEMRPDGLGCYPMRDAPDFPRHTPHLDRLADEGILFKRHYCNSPICVSSRACILTANHCERHGVYCNEGYWPGFRSPVILPTIHGHFASQGYDLANFGKVHFPRDWRQWQHDDQRGGEMNFWHHLGEEGVQMIRTLGRGQGGMIGGCYPESEPYPPRQVTDNAIRWLDNRDKSKPWLVRLSILQPHTPVLPPAGFRRLYDGIPWQRPQTMPSGVSRFQQLRAQLQDYPDFPTDLMAQAARDYYALCAWVDSEVGRIMDYLQRNNLIQDTIVVFTADHGCHIGEQGLNEKHTFVPGVQGVPFILQWTGTLPQGRTDESLSESVDLARTLCDLTGIRPDESYRGRSLVSGPEPEAVYATIGFGETGSKLGPNAGRGDWLDGRGWPRRTCVRTRRYRYDRNTRIEGRPVNESDKDVFLADSLQDPAETMNLANVASLATVRQHLENLLAEHIKHSIEVDPACLMRAATAQP